MKTSLRFTIVLVVLALLVAGCMPAVAPAANAPGEAVMTRALTTEPATIDPQGAPNSGLNLIMPYLFDTLVVRDVDNTLLPALAESWSVADDGLSITVVLKPGVVFHDGTPMNAEAVKFSFERFKETGVASPIYEGINQIAAIDVVDDLTVRFVFDAPAANFWSTISMPYAAIVSPASAEAAGEGGHLVGTGPFVLSDWQAGQSLTLTRNEDYAWGPATVQNQGAPYLDKLVFKLIPDAATQLAALETGEVDVIFINQPSQYQQLTGNPDVTLHQTVLNSLIYLGFNCRKAPFDEPLVRQALSHAVNKDEIVSLALGGLGEAATAPLPSTLPGFDPSLADYALGLDLDKAAALLEQAGFVKNADGAWERDGQVLQGRLLTSTRAPNEAIATLLQSQLAALGVPVEIQQLDSKAVMEATAQGEFELLLFRYDWNDPDALNIFLSTARIGSTNRVGYSNPDVDALLEQGAHELDEAARIAIYVEAQKLILQDAPWQPLYYPIDVIAVRNRIEGAQPGYMGRLLVNDAKVVAP
jgi:peptide/nickel transport system substrate-binding protein